MVARARNAGDFDAVLGVSGAAPAQDATSAPARERMGSWTLPAPAGAYGALVAWPSAPAWFDAVMDVLRTPDGEAARRRAKVAPDTLLRVAYADRTAADQRTGRGVATAHETVAAQLGMSSKTVQRARQLLEAMGLAVTVAEGRYLTTTERRQARAKHGGDQVRAASTRALVMPAGYRPPVDAADENLGAVENVYLPPSTGVNSSSHLSERSPRRAHARASKAAAPRRPAKTKSTAAKGLREPRSLEVQRLAAGLCRRMPWLDRHGRHVGGLCDLLERHDLVGRGWTVERLLHEVDRRAVKSKLRVAAIDDQRDPLAYFAWLLRATLPAGAAAPQFAAADERRRRSERQAAERTQEATRRAELAEESAAIEAAIAAMHAEFPTRPSRRR
ncbi:MULTISPECIES: hypothetical protein [Microbacterium]|uniref:hypothetical protein n=1 Tax=Microbacterium TaxID=33882 RepID=UPI0013A581E5|nr:MULTISPECIES: hypothetical protein [Microbacterium]